MGNGAVITVELTEENGVTTLVTLMDYGSKEARDAAVLGLQRARKRRR